MSSSYRSAPKTGRPATASIKQAPTKQAPVKQASFKEATLKEVTSFWAHIRVMDSKGSFHSFGRLEGAENTPFFGVKLWISLLPSDANISIRGVLNNGLKGSAGVTQPYIATFPRHSRPNGLNNNLSAGFTNLVLLDSTNPAFPSPPGPHPHESKITHYLSWNAKSALTMGWNAPIISEIKVSPTMAAELTLFHKLSQATRVEAWLLGARHLPATIEALGKIPEPRKTLLPTSLKPGDRLAWGDLTPLSAGTKIASQPRQTTFANDTDYEMALKTAVLRENEMVVRQTEVLLSNAHYVALVHLKRPKVSPRQKSITTQNESWFKAYVKLRCNESRENGFFAHKIDAGLKIKLAWTRELCTKLGIAMLPSGLPPTWGGWVDEADSELDHQADLVLVLKKPANTPAPCAAEPNQPILDIHVHWALLKAELNETSARRQFAAISAVAADQTSDIWPSLLNQEVVAKAFSDEAYDLVNLARASVDNQLKEALVEETKLQEENRALIAKCIKEEKQAAILPFPAPRAAKPVATNESTIHAATSFHPSNTSQYLPSSSDLGPPHGRPVPSSFASPTTSVTKPVSPLPAPQQISSFPSTINMLAAMGISNTVTPWPTLPDLPRTSSKEMQKEEIKRIADFMKIHEQRRKEAYRQIETGNKFALRLAVALNPMQRLAFLSSCRCSPGFTLLTGPPGTGKSFVLARIVAAYVAVMLKALVTAPSNYAVNVLALRLFRGSSGDTISFTHPNSLGLTYWDIVRMYPNHQESKWARFENWAEDTDEVLLHLMQAEEANDSAHAMRQLSLAGHIYRLAESTRGLKGSADPWKEYRLLVAGKPQRRSFKTCYNEIAAAVMTRAKIVLATLNSCQLPLIRRHFSPALIVIDEAAQANEPDCLIPFAYNYPGTYCRLMAGDERQLAPTVLSKGVSEQADQLAFPLFSRLKVGGSPTCMLEEQYRMVPPISALPNSVIYKSKLKDHSSTFVEERPLAIDFLSWAKLFGAPPTNRIFVDVEASNCLIDEVSRSRFNLPHLAAIVSLLEKLLTGPRPFFRPMHVNVLVYYKAQLSLLDNYLRRRAEVEKNKLWTEIKVCTVDSYQGKEREIIILDLVVTGKGDINTVGFVRDNGRLNMALSRAQNGLLVVGQASGIYKLKGVSNDALLCQLGANAINTKSCWRSKSSDRDWFKMSDSVRKEATQAPALDVSALKASKEKTPTLDIWELGEFRAGTINEDRANLAPPPPSTLGSGLAHSDRTMPNLTPAIPSRKEKPARRRMTEQFIPGAIEPAITTGPARISSSQIESFVTQWPTKPDNNNPLEDCPWTQRPDSSFLHNSWNEVDPDQAAIWRMLMDSKQLW